MTLQDAAVAVATLDPAKAFGGSAAGPLQFRMVVNGVPGGWQPLATLVRLPLLTELKCPATPELACKLSGTNLFLIDSVSSEPKFEHPVRVPDGFPGSALPVPHPSVGPLYLKLRDDPSIVNTAALGAQQLPSSPEEAARAPARHAAAQVEDGAPAGQAPQAPTSSSAGVPSPAGTAQPPSASGQSAQAPAAPSAQTSHEPQGPL